MEILKNPNEAHPFDYYIQDFEVYKLDYDFFYRNSFGLQEYKTPYNLTFYHLTCYLNHLELAFDIQTRTSPVLVELTPETNTMKLIVKRLISVSLRVVLS